MKATRAILDALAKAEREGRVASAVTVNHAALGHPTLGVIPGENEAAFQARVIAFAQAKGWRIAHFRPMWDKDGKRMVTAVAGDGKGFPDLELVRERIVKVELKVKKRRRLPDQLAWAEAYQRAGVEYYCWYPEDREEIERVLA